MLVQEEFVVQKEVELLLLEMEDREMRSTSIGTISKKSARMGKHQHQKLEVGKPSRSRREWGSAIRRTPNGEALTQRPPWHGRMSRQKQKNVEGVDVE